MFISHHRKFVCSCAVEGEERKKREMEKKEGKEREGKMVPYF